MNFLIDNHYYRLLDILDDLCHRGINPDDPPDIAYAVHRAKRLMREIADASEQPPVVRWLIEATPLAECDVKSPPRLDADAFSEGGTARPLPTWQNAPAANRTPATGIGMKTGVKDDSDCPLFLLSQDMDVVAMPD